jgi:hypothetical protein
VVTQEKERLSIVEKTIVQEGEADHRMVKGD